MLREQSRMVAKCNRSAVRDCEEWLGCFLLPVQAEPGSQDIDDIMMIHHRAVSAWVELTVPGVLAVDRRDRQRRTLE